MTISEGDMTQNHPVYVNEKCVVSDGVYCHPSFRARACLWFLPISFTFNSRGWNCSGRKRSDLVMPFAVVCHFATFTWASMDAKTQELWREHNSNVLPAFFRTCMDVRSGKHEENNL